MTVHHQVCTSSLQYFTMHLYEEPSRHDPMHVWISIHLSLYFSTQSPPRSRHLSSHVTKLLTSALQNSAPCDFNHPITAVFMLLSLANSWAQIWSYRVRKRWKSLSARHGLYGRYSKTVHLKHYHQSCVLQLRYGAELLCMSKTPVVSSPGYCCLMAARNHSRVAHYVTALTVVAFPMKSTNHTPWQSQNITAITLQADWSNLICIAGTWDIGSPCLHILSPGVTVNWHLATTDNAFEEIMTMDGILLEEGESSTNSLQLVVFW